MSSSTVSLPTSKSVEAGSGGLISPTRSRWWHRVQWDSSIATSEWLVERNADDIEPILDDVYSASLADFRLASGAGGLAMVWVEPSEHDSDLHAALYDTVHDVWGKPRALVEDPQAETYLAAGLFHDDEEAGLVVVYDRTEIVEVPALDPGDDLPDVVRGRTDLAMLRYPFLDDLTLDGITFRCAPADAGPGDPVELLVDVTNAGGTALDQVDVRFYAEGQEIGTTQVVGPGDPPFAPGESLEAALGWTLPAEMAGSVEISAEADPDFLLDEPAARRIDNFVDSLFVGTPDLFIPRATWDEVGPDRYSITARVTNRGSVTARSSTGQPPRARIRKDGADGTILLDRAIPELAPQQSFELALGFDAEPGAYEPITFLIEVDAGEDAVIAELDKTNNVRELVVSLRPPDFTPPEIALDPSITVEAESPQGAIVDFASSASDDYSGSVAVECVPPSGSVFPLGATLVVCTATDFAGNRAEATLTVTVQDTTPPQFSHYPLDATVECDGVPDPDLVTADDLYDGAVDVLLEQTRIAGPCTDSYTHLRSWAATDSNSNSTSHLQTLAVVDTTPPLLDGLPENLTVECDAIPPAPRITAADNCDPTVHLTFDETRTDGSCEDGFILTRTWTATDRCRNPTTHVQVITVQDTSAPRLGLTPPDRTVECDAVPAPAPLSATDTCDEEVAVVLDEVRTAGECADDYTLTRTWTARDDCGNESAHSQVLTVVDTAPPTFPFRPGDVAVECDAVPRPPTMMVAVDRCDASVDTGFRETRIDGSCPHDYALERKWTATDNCRNVSTHAQILTVTDTVPPTLVVPDPLTVECNESGGVSASDSRIVAWRASAAGSDGCGEVTLTDDTPEFLATGVTPVTFEAFDECRNAGTLGSSVTVADTTLPAVTCAVTPLSHHRMRINYVASDVCSTVTATGSIHLGDDRSGGCPVVPVVDGQVIELKCGKKCKVTSDHGELKIEATRAGLAVTAIDEAGNVGVCEVELCH